MKMKVITILAAVMFLPVSQVQAVLDIYSDTVIQEGDYYDTVVNVYDTPPDHTTVDMTGGFVHNLRSYDSSIINMTGGEILTLEAYNTSSANVSGGEVYSLSAWDSATVNFYDDARSLSLGSFGDFGIVNMTGGSTEYLGAGYSGTINIYAGLVTDSLNAWDFATVNIFGYDLVKTSSGGRYGCGQVYGFFADDTAFTIEFSTFETYSHVNLIPEPGSLFLLGFGALLLKRKR
jgi:hypothetical protein